MTLYKVVARYKLLYPYGKCIVFEHKNVTEIEKRPSLCDWLVG